MNKDQVAGAVKETGGKIRETVDNAVGHKEGAALGTKDKFEGKIQKEYGNAKEEIKKAVGK